MPALRQGPIKSYTHTNYYNKTHTNQNINYDYLA